MNRTEAIRELEKPRTGLERLQFIETEMGCGWDEMKHIFKPSERLQMKPETRVSEAEHRGLGEMFDRLDGYKNYNGR